MAGPLGRFFKLLLLASALDIRAPQGSFQKEASGFSQRKGLGPSCGVAKTSLGEGFCSSKSELTFMESLLCARLPSVSYYISYSVTTVMVEKITAPKMATPSCLEPANMSP